MQNLLSRIIPAVPPSRLESLITRYGTAILVVFSITGIRMLLDPVLGNQASYLPYLLGVLIVVRLCGVRPALLTLFAGAVIGNYLFAVRLVADGTIRWEEMVVIAIYLVVGLGMIRAFDVLALQRRSLQGEIASRQQAEQRLRLALAGGRMGVWEWDLKTGELVWDETMYKLYGLPGDPPIDVTSYWKQIHPEDQPRLAARKMDDSSDSEFRIVHPDGQVRWIAGLETIIRNADGTLRRKVGINLDITERKLAEKRAALLLELTSALSTALKSEDVMEVIREEGLAALGAQRVGGGVSILAEDGETLDTFFFEDPSGAIQTTQSHQRQVPLSLRSPMTDAVRTRQAIWIENLTSYRKQYPDMKDEIDALTHTKALVCLPLIVQGRAIGGICITFGHPRTFTPLERSFILAVAPVCAQALERARLFARAQELTILQERQHLARELHDAVSQTMFAAMTMAEGLPRLWERSEEKAFPILEQIVTLNRSAYAEMRTLLLELRPEVIVNTPLAQLMRQLVEAVKGKKMIKVTLDLPEEDVALPAQVHMEIYRIAQEAISNIVKHSSARNLTLTLAQDASEIDLLIKDDGKGFDPTQITGGIGTMAMRERAETIGACLEITSAVGAGTSIRLSYGAAAPSPASAATD